MIFGDAKQGVDHCSTAAGKSACLVFVWLLRAVVFLLQLLQYAVPFCADCVPDKTTHATWQADNLNPDACVPLVTFFLHLLLNPGVEQFSTVFEKRKQHRAVSVQA
jgi:hypothetical protein